MQDKSINKPKNPKLTADPKLEIQKIKKTKFYFLSLKKTVFTPVLEIKDNKKNLLLGLAASFLIPYFIFGTKYALLMISMGAETQEFFKFFFSMSLTAGKIGLTTAIIYFTITVISKKLSTNKLISLGKYFIFVFGSLIISTSLWLLMTNVLALLPQFFKNPSLGWIFEKIIYSGYISQISLPAVIGLVSFTIFTVFNWVRLAKIASLEINKLTFQKNNENPPVIK